MCVRFLFVYARTRDANRFQLHDANQQPQPAYRMLKRNDEKSAEYIARHGGGPLAETPIGQGDETTHAAAAAAIGIDAHYAGDPLATAAAVAAAAANTKFNRAPGSNKPQPNKKSAAAASDAPKAAAPPPSQENVWNKRRRDEEERRRHADEQQRLRAVRRARAH